ncbi:FIST N-terminal domain-containing protein [Actinoplanes sp. NPDC051633]|uniref:FIST N-terminal domain-containing protein n=1 Tax=Actinoplanes sp. NPDC051633 TaxID=3155670 RepID=UPI00343DCF8E
MSTLTESRSGSHVTMASAVSHQPDGAAAVAELAAALGPAADLYVVFVAPGYDLTSVGAALRGHFGERVIGCTSSGNICDDGYDGGGICAAALKGGLHCRTMVVGPLDDAPAAVENAGAQLAVLRAELDDRDGFALLLTDGLARNEDVLAASLMAALGDVPIIGGSAGDGLQFTCTSVYHDGVFAENRATVTVVRSDAPFRLLRLQHHEPTDIVLVATDVDPEQRIVRAFNGRPAAQAYADAVHLPRSDVTPATFSRHPLMLTAGGNSWIRSIAELRSDGALGFFARVDLGDVLRIGASSGLLDKLDDGLRSVRAELGSLSGMLVFDCVLRRLESEEHGLTDRVGALLAEHGAVGFSTYGEQFNGMHMNQTLVAVAFA